MVSTKNSLQQNNQVVLCSIVSKISRAPGESRQSAFYTSGVKVKLRLYHQADRTLDYYLSGICKTVY